VIFRAGMGRLLMAAVLLLPASAAFAGDRIKISTGPEQGMQPQIARDIARFVAPAAGLDLEVLASAGPSESVQRLLDVPGVKMALLQSDTAFAYADAARRGNADAARLLAPIRVIAPLYRELVYFIVRSDSPLNSVHDIRDARINVGPLRSGTALTATTLYRLLFDAPIPDERVAFLDHEDALAQLIGDRSVDVVVMVAERPARLLANMKPEARRFIKLLKFDATNATAISALRVYDATTVRAASYPNLLADDMPALAATIYLVSYGPRRDEDDARLSRFARAWCKQLPRMQSEGSPQWREVELAPAELKPEWHYARTAIQETTRCSGTATPLPAITCSQQERVLGLCE
jgi:TRAP-type uncharacterized transport system substrate-binding protein